jgi:wyosine [tRNA(Phe)-imidazoG37] synthetase (radical SAM superfamily)
VSASGAGSCQENPHNQNVRGSAVESGVRATFRYALGQPGDLADWNELVSALLGYLLDVIELTTHGDPVSVNGFRLRHRSLVDQNIPIQSRIQPTAILQSRRDRDSQPYQPLAVVKAAEPRIAFLGELLQDILGLVELQEKGAPVHPDGFRLRRPEGYTVPSAGDPSPLVAQLARWCDADCRFCYHHSNPPDLAEGDASDIVPDYELQSYIDNFLPAEGHIQFRSNWAVREVLADPRALDAMAFLRKRTDKPIFFVTNGNHIDRSTALRLASLQPVSIIVSVNAVRQETRLNEMDRQPASGYRQDITEALGELVSAGVSYGASITAWPGPIMEQLEETIDALSKYSPQFIRVNLPGFTKYSDPVVWETEAVWHAVLETVQASRRRTGIPIIIIPSLFEVESSWSDPLACRLFGVIPDSPAAHAGLSAGDEIISINGYPMLSRMQLLGQLQFVRSAQAVVYRRDGRLSEATLLPWSREDSAHTKDFIGKYYFPRGLVLPFGLSSSAITEILEVGRERNADRTFLVASRLLERTVRALIDATPSVEADRLRVIYPTAEWLGGNIIINDMCVVSDFAGAIRKAGVSPKDIVVIPASGFNDWGRDLMGTHWREIERSTGARVNMLSCARFPY